MYIGGLDIGTTGCKLLLFDEAGNRAASLYREYEVKRRGGLHEVDVPAVFGAVCEILREAARYDIHGIGITSFGESFVILDENDEPLAPTMLYTDPRGREACRRLEERFGRREITLRIGTIMHEMYSLPKLMWLKENLPQVFDRAKMILLMQDYIVYMLTGVRQIDYSLAARTAAFDVRRRRWDEELFCFAGIDLALMSSPVPSGTIAGVIKPAVAEALGLSKDITIVSGAQDQISALVGADVTECGKAMDGIGTVECVPIVLPELPEDISVYESGYSCVPHINGNYACYILSYAGGAALKWFRDRLAGIPYDALDREVSEEPTELLIMPHFAGAATPYMDSASKAAIIGLTFEHGRSDIYRALLEGTSYEILLNLRKMSELGIELECVTATGGGSRSEVWLQIKADIFGIPVKSLDSEETGCAGTALLAGRAIGIYGQKTRLVHEKRIFLPSGERHEKYMSLFEKYIKIYPYAKDILSCADYREK